jgi:hypothetical protein
LSMASRGVCWLKICSGYWWSTWIVGISLVR